MYDPFDPFADENDIEPFFEDITPAEEEFGVAVFGEAFFADDPFINDQWDWDIQHVLEQQDREVNEYITAAEERAQSFQRQLDILRDPDLSGSIRGPFPNERKARRYAATVPVRTEVIYDEYDNVWYVYVGES